MPLNARIQDFTLLLTGSLCLACVAPAGSSSGAADAGPHLETRAQLVQSVAYQAVAPSFAEFASAAAELESATATWSQSAGGDDYDVSHAAAQSAWVEAMQAWQVVEMMQLGPAGAASKTIGGADLRDEVYSWPSTNSCRVDQELVLGEYANDDFINSRLVNTYGLDGLEYLLFHGGESNTCAPQLPINAEGEWDALGSEEILNRRTAYAHAIASALSTQAAALAESWSPDEGEFTQHLADPRQSGSPYKDLPTAMNELLRVMFYLDTVTKDAKLAVPAGILDCASAPCISDLESSWARASKEGVLGNLEGFKRLYHGGKDAASDTGFDDLIVAFGDEALATKISNDIETAVSTCGAVEGSFADALAADTSALDACHAAVREITNSLKGDFATLLMLSIPTEAAGDAD